MAINYFLNLILRWGRFYLKEVLIHLFYAENGNFKYFSFLICQYFKKLFSMQKRKRKKGEKLHIDQPIKR